MAPATPSDDASPASVVARLAVWARHAPGGLARVEYESGYALEQALRELRAAAAGPRASLHEIALPRQQPPAHLIRGIVEALRALPSGTLASITNWAAAFGPEAQLVDALRLLNANRDNLAQFAVCQVWWLTRSFADALRRVAPDLDSWFVLRLRLQATDAPDEWTDTSRARLEALTVEAASTEEARASLDDARVRAAALEARFERALATGASFDDVRELAWRAAAALFAAAAEGEGMRTLERLNAQARGRGLPALIPAAFAPGHAGSAAASVLEAHDARARLAALRAESPAAADLLTLAAWLGPPPVPEELLTLGARALGPALGTAGPGPTTRQVLERAVASGLACFHPLEQALGVSPQVREVIRDASSGAAAEWISRAARTVTGALSHSSAVIPPVLERLWPHVEARLDDGPRLSPTDAAELQQALARLSTTLDTIGQVERATRLADARVRLLRPRVATDPEALLPDLAESLNNLGTMLSALGRREDALAATEEAAQTYRTLAQRRPDTFLPDLAASRNNLGVMLSALGRREDALDATEEAVQIRRTLAQQRPDAFLPDLAASLNNLGLRLSELGRREDALAITEEAVQTYRTLAQQRPDAFHPDLAMSLNNLGLMLSALGRREDALDATEEAVRTYRTLAQQRPDAFLPDLARSLNNLGNRLSELGRREDALTVTEEAVQIRRTLAQQRPDAFLPALASSVNNLGLRLGELGRHEDALDATKEATQTYRALAQQRPDAFLPYLARSLNNLGLSLSELARCEDALDATEEAVQTHRTLAQQRPDAFLPDLAMSLNNLGVILSELGRREDALEAVRRAVELTLALARARPRVFGDDLQSRTGTLMAQLADAAVDPSADTVLYEARTLLAELGLAQAERSEEG